MHLTKDDVKIEESSLWSLQAMFPDQGLLLPRKRGIFLLIIHLQASYGWTFDLLHPPTMITKLSSCLSIHLQKSSSLLKQAFLVVTYFLNPCWPISSGFDFTQKSFGCWSLSRFVLTPLFLFLQQCGLWTTALAAVGHRPAFGEGYHMQQAEDFILRAGTSDIKHGQLHCPHWWASPGMHHFFHGHQAAYKCNALQGFQKIVKRRLKVGMENLHSWVQGN